LGGTNNIYLTGWTSSSNFPCQTANTFFQGTYGGGWQEAFILKFDNSGNRIWSTYYGGTGADTGNCIATDSANNIFITGTTDSNNLPTQNAGTFYQNSIGGGNIDVFILKFDNLGNRLWATYFGGSGDDFIYTNDQISINKCGNVYMGITSTSSNLTTSGFCSGNYFDNNFNGGNFDEFILEFSNSGNLVWTTYPSNNRRKR
jgi:Beta-propeller repeat